MARVQGRRAADGQARSCAVGLGAVRLGPARLLAAALLALSAPLGLAEGGAEAAQGPGTSWDGAPASAPAASLETRVSRIEGVLPHLATKADLLASEASLRKEIHASETALRKEIHATEIRLEGKIEATETRLEEKMDHQLIFLLSSIGGLAALMLGGFWWMYQLHVQLLRALVPAQTPPPGAQAVATAARESSPSGPEPKSAPDPEEEEEPGEEEEEALRRPWHGGDGLEQATMLRDGEDMAEEYRRSARKVGLAREREARKRARGASNGGGGENTRGE